MSTDRRKRIQVCFSDSTQEILHIMSTKENRSLSNMVRKITEDWLERYEDQYWCDISMQSSSTESHDEVWGTKDF